VTAPRLEVDLYKIEHNARVLVDRLAERGVSVTGVTKATLGSQEIVHAFLRAGVSGIGDSRIENIESMRRAGIPVTMTLIRSPMLSQAERVVAAADVSFNTELRVLNDLSIAAQKTGRTHGVVLMVELGDLREGIMADDLEDAVRHTLRLPNIAIKGIGTNLACRSGVSPDAGNMAELGSLATSIEATFGLTVEVVSGGNSANLNWALSDADTGRVNNLRLGESILLGREPLHRQPIEGLHTDAITLVAEVIESKIKPSLPWGTTAQTAFGEAGSRMDRGPVHQSILAVGIQDTDPDGLATPHGLRIVGASSDHLILESETGCLNVGSEVALQPDYSAVLRSMTSPFVVKSYTFSESLSESRSGCSQDVLRPVQQ
jgi:ornithine racemase